MKALKESFESQKTQFKEKLDESGNQINQLEKQYALLEKQMKEETKERLELEKLLEDEIKQKQQLEVLFRLNTRLGFCIGTARSSKVVKENNIWTQKPKIA